MFVCQMVLPGLGTTEPIVIDNMFISLQHLVLIFFQVISKLMTIFCNDYINNFYFIKLRCLAETDSALSLKTDLRQVSGNCENISYICYVL